MDKVFGSLSDFALVKEDTSRIIVSYDLEQASDGEHYTWYELYFYKKQGRPSFDVVKNSILNDINERTDKKILSGFAWEGQSIWLSSENQFNFKAAYDLAVQTQGQSLPVTFKIGEDEEENPIYHEFTEMDEFTNFYVSAINFVNETLNDGWQKKDGIDFDEYKDLLDELAEIAAQTAASANTVSDEEEENYPMDDDFNGHLMGGMIMHPGMEEEETNNNEEETNNEGE